MKRALELADPRAESVMETRLRLLWFWLDCRVRGPRFLFVTISVSSWPAPTSTIPTLGSQSSTTAQRIARASPQTTAARIGWSMRDTACFDLLQRMCCPPPILSCPL
jgi:hypothetical protein